MRVSWEQLEPDDEGRGSELEMGSESGLPWGCGSIPTKGRKPANRPSSTDAHRGSRSILRWEVGHGAQRNWIGVNEQVKSSAPQMSPYC